MEIGTEISKKIRAAIKTKLEELGAYVDEELPDYIMVMSGARRLFRRGLHFLDFLCILGHFPVAVDLIRRRYLIIKMANGASEGFAEVNPSRRFFVSANVSVDDLSA